MTRKRIATEWVMSMEKGPIKRALQASTSAESDGEFYRMVRMRNPSRTYFVDDGGKSHSLKAVMAHALQEERSDTLARDFHAADAMQRLRELGFKVKKV